MKKSELLNNKTEVDALEHFIYTVEEYQRIAKELPVNWSLNHHEIKLNEEYSAINVRAMLLRKYITNTDKVWLKTIVEKGKEVLPDQNDVLEGIYEEYVKAHSEQVEQVLANGITLNLRQTFDDLIYGVFLHADPERVSRLLMSSESMRLYCMRRFVQSIEAIVLKLNNFLIENDISPFTANNTFPKAPIVAFLKPNTKRVKEIEGYWSNIYGKKAEITEALEALLESKSSEEKQIMKCSLSFLHKLEEDETTLADMKDEVFQHTVNDWGDLSEARSFLNGIKNLGIATTINFNFHKDVAYVKVLENVEDAFLIDQPHLIPAQHITLIKDTSLNEWRVFGFGGAIDPYPDRDRRA